MEALVSCVEMFSVEELVFCVELLNIEVSGVEVLCVEEFSTEAFCMNVFCAEVFSAAPEAFRVKKMLSTDSLLSGFRRNFTSRVTVSTTSLLFGDLSTQIPLFGDEIPARPVFGDENPARPVFGDESEHSPLLLAVSEVRPSFLRNEFLSLDSPARMDMMNGPAVSQAKAIRLQKEKGVCISVSVVFLQSPC